MSSDAQDELRVLGVICNFDGAATMGTIRYHAGFGGFPDRMVAALVRLADRGWIERKTTGKETYYKPLVRLPARRERGIPVLGRVS